MCSSCWSARSAASFPPAAPAAPAATSSLDIAAPSAVSIGEPIELAISVLRGKDVSGFETVLRFDRSVAEFGGVSYEANSVAATGRGIGLLGPVERAEGASFGFYSCPTADCSTTSGARISGGAYGSVQLATARIIPAQPGLLEIAVGPFLAVDSVGRKISLGGPSSVVVDVGGAS